MRLSRPVLIAIGVAAVAGALLASIAVGNRGPLPWDMAHHVLGAAQLRDALVELAPIGALRAVFVYDLYPPGHSILLAPWLLTVSGVPSPGHLLAFEIAVLFGLLLSCFAVVVDDGRLGSRALAGTACVVFLLASPPLLALAATPMVEVTAIGWSLWALVFVARALQRDDRASLLVALGLSAAAVLTKYNVGLALAPAAVLAGGLVSLRQRQALPLARGALIAGGIAVVLFVWLLLQRDGFQAFREFAVNRTNSEGWSPAARLGWYRGILQDWWVLPGGVWIPLALGGLGAVVGPRPWCWMALGYLAVHATALALHPYLLDRSVAAPAAVLAVVAGVGLAHVATRLGRRRALAWALVVAVAVGTWPLARLEARRQLQVTLPERAAELSPLVAAVREARRASTVWVVGAFNQLSPAWWHLALGTRVALYADPTSQELEDLQVVADALSGVDVLSLKVDPESSWWDDDYQLYAASRVRAVDVLDSLALGKPAVIEMFRGSGVTVRLRHGANGAVQLGEGFGSPEWWGRWVMSRSSRIQITPPGPGYQLLLHVATPTDLTSPQVLRAEIDGKTAAQITLTGKPWTSHAWWIPLPGGEGPTELVFHAEQIVRPQGESRDLAFPVLGVALVSQRQLGS